MHACALIVNKVCRDGVNVLKIAKKDLAHELITQLMKHTEQ